eukprot:TRINITY_DN22675_c0_g1_i1.p1 TRINITY_DN22675_c0_g1~~TRINITY_DN22675_c0_g1_i1.p1  ORF type:complete len:1485 (+),score=358.07 TRINITY_DN22675_c0_g1_i1:141-4595(+)
MARSPRSSALAVAFATQRGSSNGMGRAAPQRGSAAMVPVSPRGSAAAQLPVSRQCLADASRDSVAPTDSSSQRNSAATLPASPRVSAAMQISSSPRSLVGTPRNSAAQRNSTAMVPSSQRGSTRQRASGVRPSLEPTHAVPHSPSALTTSFGGCNTSDSPTVEEEELGSATGMAVRFSVSEPAAAAPAARGKRAMLRRAKTQHLSDQAGAASMLRPEDAGRTRRSELGPGLINRERFYSNDSLFGDGSDCTKSRSRFASNDSSFDDTVVLAELQSDAEAGNRVLNLVNRSQSQLRLGQTLRLNPGGANEEDIGIAGVDGHSLILQGALRFAHKIGERVAAPRSPDEVVEPRRSGSAAAQSRRSAAAIEAPSLPSKARPRKEARGTLMSPTAARGVALAASAARQRTLRFVDCGHSSDSSSNDGASRAVDADWRYEDQITQARRTSTPTLEEAVARVADAGCVRLEDLPPLEHLVSQLLSDAEEEGEDVGLSSASPPLLLGILREVGSVQMVPGGTFLWLHPTLDMARHAAASSQPIALLLLSGELMLTSDEGRDPRCFEKGTVLHLSGAQADAQSVFALTDAAVLIVPTDFVAPIRSRCEEAVNACLDVREHAAMGAALLRPGAEGLASNMCLLLQAMPFLEDHHAGLIRQMCYKMERIHAAADTLLVHPDDSPDKMFIVVAGTLKLYVDRPRDRANSSVKASPSEGTGMDQHPAGEGGKTPRSQPERTLDLEETLGPGSVCLEGNVLGWGRSGVALKCSEPCVVLTLSREAYEEVVSEKERQLHRSLYVLCRVPATRPGERAVRSDEQLRALHDAVVVNDPVFDVVPKSTLCLLLGAATLHRAQKGTLLFGESEPGGKMYCILRGNVSVQKREAPAKLGESADSEQGKEEMMCPIALRERWREVCTDAVLLMQVLAAANAREHANSAAACFAGPCDSMSGQKVTIAGNADGVAAESRSSTVKTFLAEAEADDAREEASGNLRTSHESRGSFINLDDLEEDEEVVAAEEEAYLALVAEACERMSLPIEEASQEKFAMHLQSLLDNCGQPALSDLGRLVGVVKAGSTIGSQTLLRSEPRMASVTTLDNTLFMVVDSEDANAIMREKESTEIKQRAAFLSTEVRAFGSLQDACGQDVARLEQMARLLIPSCEERGHVLVMRGDSNVEHIWLLHHGTLSFDAFAAASPAKLARTRHSARTAQLSTVGHILGTSGAVLGEPEPATVTVESVNCDGYKVHWASLKRLLPRRALVELQAWSTLVHEHRLESNRRVASGSEAAARLLERNAALVQDNARDEWRGFFDAASCHHMETEPAQGAYVVSVQRALKQVQDAQAAANAGGGGSNGGGSARAADASGGRAAAPQGSSGHAARPQSARKDNAGRRQRFAARPPPDTSDERLRAYLYQVHSGDGRKVIDNLMIKAISDPRKKDVDAWMDRYLQDPRLEGNMELLDMRLRLRRHRARAPPASSAASALAPSATTAIPSRG